MPRKPMSLDMYTSITKMDFASSVQLLKVVIEKDFLLHCKKKIVLTL